MNNEITQADFLELQESYFKQAEVLEKYTAINDRFETQVKNALRLRDRARSGETNERISITLYDWMKKYLSVTKRYEYIEGIVLDGRAGRIVIDYIERSLSFQAD